MTTDTQHHSWDPPCIPDKALHFLWARTAHEHVTRSALGRDRWREEVLAALGRG